MRVSTFLFLMLGCLSATLVKAEIIDFETLPGGVPSDDLPINTQYLVDFGVTFGLDTDGDGFADPGQYPIMEAQGADGADGFNNDTLGLRDTAAPGFEGDLGRFFLRGISSRSSDRTYHSLREPGLGSEWRYLGHRRQRFAG